jgi:hypothetical protein
MGSFQIAVVEKLLIDKISPMSGPMNGNTVVKLYGSGFNNSIPQDKHVFVKFGTQETEVMDKKELSAIGWSEQNYHSDLNLPASLMHNAELFDTPVEEDAQVQVYYGATTPDITSIYGDASFLGGPVYVQLKERIEIKTVNHGERHRMLAGGAQSSYIDTIYPDSSNLEFFFYRKPFVKKIEPTSGLATGGTELSITGGLF